MNVLKIIIIVIIFAGVILSNSLFASDYIKGNKNYTKNVVYVELEPWLIVSCISMNYEYLLSKNLSLRAGVGMGGIICFNSCKNNAGRGVLFMLNYLSSGEHKFELGIGSSIMYIDKDFNNNGDVSVFPSISIAYRYQPADYGFFFRSGFTFVYYGGFPIQISIGFAF